MRKRRMVFLRRAVTLAALAVALPGCAWAPAAPIRIQEATQAPGSRLPSPSGPPISVTLCKKPPNCPA